MIRVAIYARHSSEKQSSSTTDQIGRCKAYCQTKQYLVSGIYHDEALSGATPPIGRPGIQKLFDAVDYLSVEKIICEDLSRLSRDQEDVSAIFKRFAFQGVQIETVTEGVINELHIGLKGTMNALYLRDLADKTRRGQIAAAKKGRIAGGKSYGYDAHKKILANGEVEGGYRTINEAEAQIICEIFDLYRAGHTLRDISLILNSRGVPPPRQGRWTPSLLCGTLARKTGILRNSLYMGVYTFNKMTYKKNPETGKRISHMNPESEWITVEIPHLAIVQPEHFLEVQEKLEGRARRRKEMPVEPDVPFWSDQERKRNKREVNAVYRKDKQPIYQQHPSSRRLRCAHCDCSITSKDVYRFYCKNESCPNDQPLRKRILHATILEALNKLTEADLRPFGRRGVDRATLNRKRHELIADHAREQAKIREILDQLPEQGPETLQYLHVQENECYRLMSLIKKARKDLIESRPLRREEREKIVKKVQVIVKKHRKDEENYKYVRELQQAIKYVHVTDPQTVRIEYDLEKLARRFADRIYKDTPLQGHKRGGQKNRITETWPSTMAK